MMCISSDLLELATSFLTRSTRQEVLIESDSTTTVLETCVTCRSKLPSQLFIAYTVFCPTMPLLDSGWKTLLFSRNTSNKEKNIKSSHHMWLSSLYLNSIRTEKQFHQLRSNRHSFWQIIDHLQIVQFAKLNVKSRFDMTVSRAFSNTAHVLTNTHVLRISLWKYL